jgi:hypothetical protein
MLHKERKPWDNRAEVTLVVFTQVWAAVKRKTLLLLWWIEERTVVVAQCSSLARWPRGEQLSRMSVQGSESLLRLPWPSVYRLRGYHSGKQSLSTD